MKTKEDILKEFGDLKFENKQHFGRNADSEMIFEKVFKPLLSKSIAQTREETLKEIIREYQDNELDGKDYDFYFSIRAKIDELNKLKK